MFASENLTFHPAPWHDWSEQCIHHQNRNHSIQWRCKCMQKLSTHGGNGAVTTPELTIYICTWVSCCTFLSSAIRIIQSPTTKVKLRVPHVLPRCHRWPQPQAQPWCWQIRSGMLPWPSMGLGIMRNQWSYHEMEKIQQVKVVKEKGLIDIVGCLNEF